jgi:hypothetical protein
MEKVTLCVAVSGCGLSFKVLTICSSIAAILTDRMDITIKPFQTVVVRKRFVPVSSTN